jgi:hypothetical protein
MDHVIVVVAISGAYILLAIMCICKRDSMLSASRLRTERILQMLEMEESDYEQQFPTPPA